MIILLGYMGVGKSSVAKQLAKTLNLKYIDLDDFVEQKENKSISDIFKEKGEIYFRKIENQYLNELLSSKSYDILALGGGTPCYANNLELINANEHQSFYLKMDLTALTERLFRIKANRPLIAHILEPEEMKDFIRKHLFERQFYYLQAKHIIDVSRLSIEEVVEAIL